MYKNWARLSLLVLTALLAVVPARAELLEEIVAWVNGDIITMSELQEQEQAMISEAYRGLTGEQLDRAVADIKTGVLIQMIDNRIMVDRAAQLYNLDSMADSYFDGFMREQGYTDKQEFLQVVAQEGFDEESLKERLVEMFAPEQVVRFEVSSRISVSEAAMQAFYAENQDAFRTPASASIREIVIMAETPEKRQERKAEALEAIERSKTEGFDAVAEQVSEAGTKSAGGLIGGLERGDLSETLEQIAFSLPIGETSEPIETPYGWHILKIESRTDEAVKPLDEIKDQVRKAVESTRYQENLASFLLKARQEAEWCVKPKYAGRLSIPSPDCKFR